MNFPLILKRPLIFFDLETTGLDFKYDRIIEIGAVKIFPDGKRETFIKRVNPQMRVPAEITALTGISDEEASKEPTLSDIMPELSKFFEDSDLAGYHIGRFDAKVMVEEFRRAGADFKLDDRAIVDSQIIFHQKEKRDLSAAYKFYCQKELNNAHSAKADTEATLEILVSQIERYTDLPRDVQALD
jgi:DNA polymerase-3 subunit epsilon